MKVYALFYGGSSYAPSELPKDLEQFDSILHCKQQLLWRMNDPFYPCLENPCFHVFKSKPSVDPYPDFILKIGPKGGIVRELC